MNNFLELLDEKFQDIDIFINRLYELNTKTNVIIEKNVVKSTILMILYNVVESMLTHLLEYLHDLLSQEEFLSCRKEIQLIYIKYYIVENKINNLSVINNFIENNIKIPSFQDFNKKCNIFSGNLDLRKIKDILKEIYGIMVFKEDEADDTLLIIKNKRNDLAHGEVSYRHACRDYTIEEIEKKARNTKEILKKIINEMDIYVIKKLYLKR